MPCAVLAQAQLSEAQREFFENRIRPVFAQQCFVCHTNSKMAGLRLDTREDILKGGKSGPAIVPGDPDKSLLVSAIKHTGPVAMPKAAGKLTDSQVSDITQWVKEGAFWPTASGAGGGVTMTEARKKYWAIQPLAKAPAPKVKDSSWPLNDIDRFVLATIEQKGLKPAGLADRRSLIRRLSYDLTGLLPTYEEVVAFESDKTPKAYEKVVDRLLASPRYGERWARHWMDVVRFGEDDYNVGKRPDRAERYAQAYHYRDWLINAINSDMPYDTFVRAQLAGDLMPADVRDKMTGGLGLHGTGVWKFEDNPAPVERADEWFDKVDVTTKAFLGLTVGCARCHDHKYDPIPTKDYYSLAGVFASSEFHAYPLVPKEQAAAYDKQKKELEAREEKLKKFQADASDLIAQIFFSQTEDYMIAAWRVATQKRATVASIAEEYKLDSEVLEKWTKFLKKAPNNYSYLKAWQDMIKNGGGSTDDAYKLAKEFQGKLAEVNTAYLKLKQQNEAELAKLKDVNQETFDPLPNGKKRRLNKHQVELKGLDREQTYLWRDVFETDLPENPGNLNAEDDKKTPGLFKLEGYSLEKRLTSDMAAHLARLKANIETLKKTMGPEYPAVYGIAESKEPTDLRVFLRGNPYSFGEEAPRGFLTMLSDGSPKQFTKGSGRLELADAIVQHPLAARVMANRLWKWHMGAGFIETTNNFGVLAGGASNRDLLDHLATRFLDHGMSWKKMHKEIVMSRTYQLSVSAPKESFDADPANRLYARYSRQRLDAEGIWDSLLAASGKLDLEKIGGPSQELKDGMNRRAVYGNVSRMYPNDFMRTFDFPPATIAADMRYTTNVPQQRLFFLNNEFVHRQAEALADRLNTETTNEAKVTKAFQLALQRKPSPEELQVGIEMLKTAASETPAVAPAPDRSMSSPAASSLAGKPEKPDAMAEADSSEADKEKKKPAVKINHTPLKSLCWGLLSSNEFLFLN
jgi:hypothetical protein